MRVLYLHNASIHSEKANLKQVKLMCRAISDSGNQVVLSLLGNDGSCSNEIIDDERNYLIHIRPQIINDTRFGKYFQSKIIRETVKKFNPDLVYLRSVLLLYQLENIDIPVIIELHNNKLHKGSNLLDKYWRHFLNKHSKTSRILKIVCISKALSNYWVKKGLPAGKVITGHSGIDRNQFENYIKIEEAKKNLNLNVNKKIVTYLGRLYKNRRIDNVLVLARNYPEVQFLIVGGPQKEVERIKEILKNKQISNVLLIGQIPHNKIIDYLYASDVLLAIWSSEVNTIDYCSPLKLFEYMGAGRTIVAHGFPTILEVLKDQHNAIICEPDSTEDLIKKVGKALGVCESSDLGRNARKEVFEKYTWQKRVDKIFKDLPISY